jgi:tyrosyl-tRNA synthetase
MFQRRFKKGQEVWLNELLYPLMQGYDSVAMDVDLEIGGRDQLFNMLIGRKLQKIYHKKEKFILTTDMLTGLDGREMSKTYHNVVNLTDKPNEMYGKIMSLKDELILHYFELCTDINLLKIKEMKKDLQVKKVNPRGLKAKLAREIVSIYHGKQKAQRAEKEFNLVFRERKLPSAIKGVKIKEKRINILELLVKTHQATSKSDAKRLVLQGAVKINDILIDDWQRTINIKKGVVIKVGKRKFIRIA